MALTLSKNFDLRKTYFLIAGIAGVNPKIGTLADVAFAKYAVQVALQYEVDARELNPKDNMTTGYIPFGAKRPSEYPSEIYGTEVFEVNEALRDLAVGFAQKANLTDSDVAQKYRTNYAGGSNNNVKKFRSAARKPGILTCDVATSDVWYSGNMLSESFDETMKLFTNGYASHPFAVKFHN